MSYSIVSWRHVSTLEDERRSGSHKALQSGAEEQNNFRPRPGVQAAPRGSSVALLRRRQHTPCRERHVQNTISHRDCDPIHERQLRGKPGRRALYSRFSRA
ncbi:hypothetical protein FA13DRAFT_1508015 [Coprinellus micaceus]|uniref:Uncharacterized protein n=1 Tax=Coprinellus micaceus TaxID=71717 RepID=A0A4Y7SL07_COPMI|nr:hypothetical protein FA13DRAFT_1508015 [Coprinellus micaceus]